MDAPTKHQASLLWTGWYQPSLVNTAYLMLIKSTDQHLNVSDEFWKVSSGLNAAYGRDQSFQVLGGGGGVDKTTRGRSSQQKAWGLTGQREEPRLWASLAVWSWLSLCHLPEPPFLHLCPEGKGLHAAPTSFKLQLAWIPCASKLIYNKCIHILLSYYSNFLV